MEPMVGIGQPNQLHFHSRIGRMSVSPNTPIAAGEANNVRQFYKPRLKPNNTVVRVAISSRDRDCLSSSLIRPMKLDVPGKGVNTDKTDAAELVSRLDR